MEIAQLRCMDGEQQRCLHLASAEDVLEAVQVICTKVRDGDKRIVRLKEGSPKGRHVVIVDDLVQSGGTLIECQRLLKTQVRACWESVYYTSHSMLL